MLNPFSFRIPTIVEGADGLDTESPVIWPDYAIILRFGQYYLAPVELVQKASLPSGDSGASFSSGFSAGFA